MKRYSSRQSPGTLGKHFLADRLKNALHYDRIAGYFSSSILEIAGEQIEEMAGTVRMICNSELDFLDVQTARAAALMNMTQEWKVSIDQAYSEKIQHRLTKLHALLQSKKLDVRVLPDKAFGLVHGKAGVITYQDGRKTSFMGSANESKSAWALNYELVWEDESAEAVTWVQTEFDALWNDPLAIPLAEAIIQDIQRLSRRSVVSHEKWKEEQAKPEAVIVESPIYRQNFGLWAHQKYFVKRAYDEHLSGRGARFVLADQVGLGKTVQLALAAMLMALKGDKPVLVICPKTLVWQWQEELMKLLQLPSAVWDGKAWVDENDIRYENNDPEKAILKCPRRFGIISQGLIIHGSGTADKLSHLEYECVIVDEAHRSRRKNLKAGAENVRAEPNNLMKFLLNLSKCTKSMLLATATPVQLYPIEAYDLLCVLGAGSPHVLGNEHSRWHQADKTIAFQLVDGSAKITTDKAKKWEWVRNPFPPSSEESRIFGAVRSDLNLLEMDYFVRHGDENRISPGNKRKVDDLDDFFTRHNPYIRHIIRRTRHYLETTRDPETQDFYLQPVAVELLGDRSEDALRLPPYLEQAYHTAEEFCTALGDLMRGSGFTRTLLLRRMGSSLEAGRKTAYKMLTGAQLTEELEDDMLEEEGEEEITLVQSGIAGKLSDRERNLLKKLLAELDLNRQADPKLEKLRSLLFLEAWADKGCIVFSQYYDTVQYFAQQIAREKPETPIGVYAGANKSGIWKDGLFTRTTKEVLKSQVQSGQMQIIFGTDSASEGLNLQRLGTLINLDLPWNPTRLEQRKGRIQRIGQRMKTVYVYNMRYKDSVEERVHQVLSQRLANIFSLFGNIPDILNTVWIDAALGEIEKAKERIQEVETRSPFEIRYDMRPTNVDFETCTEVLNAVEVREILQGGW